MRAHRRIQYGVSLFAFLALAPWAGAQQQPFVYTNSDLNLTFRKVAPYTENNEVVVNIGQASNYVNLTIGTTVQVRGYSPSQLVSGSFSSYDNLSWSVFGWYVSGSGYPGYPSFTLWLTVPRTDNAVRSTDASRYDSAMQSVVKGKMASVFPNAAFVSRAIGTSNLYNNATFIRESIATYPTHMLSVWVGGLVDPTIGTLNDTWTDNNIENGTQAGFTGSGGSVRSDLYEIRPLDDGHGGIVVDPHTGTSGLAYYVGYFEFKSDGTMTFKREAASTNHPPPPPPVLSITRAGTQSTISFVSSNTATYKLFFTNSAGLPAPASSWPQAPGSITGDGTTKSFQDSTTDSDRVYRVQGQ